MDWITDQVAIGNQAEAHDAAMLHRHGLRSILSLDGSLDPSDAGRLGVGAVRAFDLVDGPGNEPGVLGRAVTALEDLLQNHAPVLVHCYAGRSRSVVVVAGYLVRSRCITPEEAIALVADKRVICITPEFEALLYDLDTRRHRVER